MYDMIEQFKKFEEEKGLLTDRVADFYYWVYVRFNVYMKLEEIANRQVKLTVKKNHIQIQDLFFLYEILHIIIRYCTMSIEIYFFYACEKNF